MAIDHATNLKTWQAAEATAESMIPVIGRLYRNRDILLYVYGRKLVRKSAVEIVKSHESADRIIDRKLTVHETWPFVEALDHLSDINSAKVDIGKLAVDHAANHSNQSVAAYVAEALAGASGDRGVLLDEPTDVVLYGFGRIGRIIARLLIDRVGSGSKLRLAAIVLRPGAEDDVQKRASLLELDSIHGQFDGTITVDDENDRIIANGSAVQLIYAKSPTDVDYTDYGIDNAIIVDNTGVWRDLDGLGNHLKAPGASRVLLTAPGKDGVKNVIYGVNDDIIEPDDAILSAASCTTNAIVPVLKVMNDTYGIDTAHLETVHAYTNDQNLTDNFHKKSRRGRSAPLNMVITETGAAKAVAKAIPELDGKLTGNAIRVPVPNVSLAILNLNLDRTASAEEINEVLRRESLSTKLGEQIEYMSSTELVSSDLVGADRTGIVDSEATVAHGRGCVLYVWYDNEAGYSYQVMRLVQQMAGCDLPQLPAIA